MVVVVAVGRRRPVISTHAYLQSHLIARQVRAAEKVRHNGQHHIVVADHGTDRLEVAHRAHHVAR